MIAEWNTFRLAYKCEPMNWRDFRYGMEQIMRDRAQRQIDMLDATRGAADVSGKGYEKLRQALAVEAGHTRLA